MFLARCVGSQPRGRWDVATSSTIWLTPVSHVPHHCPMRRSSESQRTRRVLHDCLWCPFCLCASPRVSHSPFPSVPSQNRDTVGGGGTTLVSEICATKKCFLVKIIIMFTLDGLTPCADHSLYSTCLQFCHCYLYRTFLQHDSWGEDRCRQQISLCRKCKTCVSVFSSYWACVFSTPLIWWCCWKSQVDYGATADELEIHFNGCGPVNRVTILCDRFSGHPKG